MGQSGREPRVKGREAYGAMVRVQLIPAPRVESDQPVRANLPVHAGQVSSERMVGVELTVFLSKEDYA